MKGCMIRARWILCLFFIQAVVRAELPDLMPEESESGGAVMMEPPAEFELGDEKTPQIEVGNSPPEVIEAAVAKKESPVAKPVEEKASISSLAEPPPPYYSAPAVSGAPLTPAASNPLPVDVPTLSSPQQQAYQVVPNGNNLELITPYGRRILFGDQALKKAGNYRFEIPLSELRPPAVEAEKPAAPPSPTVIYAPMGREPASEKNETPNPNPPAAPVTPPRVVVEYDNSDRLILEANRLYNRGKYYEAALTVEELLVKRPELPRAWVMKGSLMYVQGQRDLAKNAWQKALELDPENKEVQNFLGRLK